MLDGVNHFFEHVLVVRKGGREGGREEGKKEGRRATYLPWGKSRVASQR